MTALWATSPSPGPLQMPAAGQGPTNLAAPFAWKERRGPRVNAMTAPAAPIASMRHSSLEGYLPLSRAGKGLSCGNEWDAYVRRATSARLPGAIVEGGSE